MKDGSRTVALSVATTSGVGVTITFGNGLNANDAGGALCDNANIDAAILDAGIGNDGAAAVNATADNSAATADNATAADTGAAAANATTTGVANATAAEIRAVRQALRCCCCCSHRLGFR